MKFLITWQLHEGKLHDTLARFAQMSPEEEQALMGPGMKIIGRWHDLVRGQGAAIYECETVEAIAAYSLGWNSDMDLDIAAVTDDEETRAIAKQVGNRT